MSEATDRAQRLASMIEQRARETLDPLNRRMVVDRWPAEFQAIMWRAVADIAAREAAKAEAEK